MNIIRNEIVKAPTSSTGLGHVYMESDLTKMDGRGTKIKKQEEEEETKKKEKEDKKKEADKANTEAYVDYATKEAKLNEAYRQGPSLILKRILTEFYIKSLALDEDFVQANRIAFENTINDYVDNNGGINLIKENDSNFCQSLYKICKEMTSKVTSRLLTESNNKDAKAIDINFDLNEEEENDLNKKMEDLSIDEITKLVKDKVVQVVMDEKRSAMKQKKEIEEAEEEIKNSEDIESEEDLEKAKKLEKAKEDAKGEEATEESTLFGTMMSRNYKRLLEAADSVEIGDPEEHVEDPDESFVDELMDDDDIEFDDFINDPDDEDYENDFLDSLNEGSFSINEKALAETICEYTLYETMNTLKIKTYTTMEVKKLIEDIKNEDDLKEIKTRRDARKKGQASSTGNNVDREVVEEGAIENFFDNAEQWLDTRLGYIGDYTGDFVLKGMINKKTILDREKEYLKQNVKGFVNATYKMNFKCPEVYAKYVVPFLQLSNQYLNLLQGNPKTTKYELKKTADDIFKSFGVKDAKGIKAKMDEELLGRVPKDFATITDWSGGPSKDEHIRMVDRYIQFKKDLTEKHMMGYLKDMAAKINKIMKLEFEIRKAGKYKEYIAIRDEVRKLTGIIKTLNTKIAGNISGQFNLATLNLDRYIKHVKKNGKK